jgi:hypothetical protein
MDDRRTLEQAWAALRIIAVELEISLERRAEAFADQVEDRIERLQDVYHDLVDPIPTRRQP